MERCNHEKPQNYLQAPRIFESLEPRNLLAGNVTADASSGALIILGDGSANIITVTQTAPDTYKVAGTATNVNGTSSAKTFYATDGIFINMNGGNDVLTVKNLTDATVKAAISAWESCWPPAPMCCR